MKYAIVGTGSRHKMYRDAIVSDYARNHELVALCDSNAHRLNLAAEAVGTQGTTDTNGVATYTNETFTELLAEQNPDVIVITTPDFLHHDYIAAALEAGCDVICEKPLTIDLDQLKTITDIQRTSKRAIIVTFNTRYSPSRTQVKDILMAGSIGQITAVDFRWHLNRVHGADYFRRWHRQKKFSGGLLIHKASHHFDLLNWWLASTPTRVLATGSRKFYTPQNARELGLDNHAERCADCKLAPKCAFALDLDRQPELRSLYRDGEHLDGYFRDRCVFDGEIDIEDTVQAHINFANGANANYSLVAYSPWEGLEIIFQGTKGELTHRHVESPGIFDGEHHPSTQESISTILHLNGEMPQKLDVWRGEGAHGGADPVMLKTIFAPENQPEDIYDRASNHIMGAWSVLTGIAANKSMETGSVVDIDTMLSSHDIILPRPGFPKYPMAEQDK